MQLSHENLVSWHVSCSLDISEGSAYCTVTLIVLECTLLWSQLLLRELSTFLQVRSVTSIQLLYSTRH